MTREQQFKTVNLINHIAFIIDNKNVVLSQKKVCKDIAQFFKNEKITFSKIESIVNTEVKDYLYCLMFVYITNNSDVIYKNKLFKSILSYYKIWKE